MSYTRKEILQSGAWQIDSVDATSEHIHDRSLADGLIKFFKYENVESIIDLGAGMGNYTDSFRNEGLFSNCYDGNPNTQKLSSGRCAIVDLSKEIKLMPHDWTLILEVGEHVPAEYEDILIQNIDKVNTKGVILSWAVEGQGGYGHINCRNNDYIKERFESLGYINDEQLENDLRDVSSLSWFKETIMVFRKNNEIEETNLININEDLSHYDL